MTLAKRLLAPVIIFVCALMSLGVGQREPANTSREPGVEQVGPTPPRTDEPANPVATPTPPQPPPYTAEARELLGGLAPGDVVAGFQVMGISGFMPDDTIRIELAANGISFAAVIAPRGKRPHAPPKQTANYDLFYAGLEPKHADPSTVMSVLDSVQARILQHE